MITNPAHAPDIQDYHRHVQRLERERPLRTCCTWYGSPVEDDGEDNDVTAYLREWLAGVAAKRPA